MPMETPSAQSSDRRDFPSFKVALRYWFRLGWISFGGPAGQIAIMRKEPVEKRHWIFEGYFMHAPKCHAITPVPGGVGPMTIAMLVSNTIKAARK